MERKQINFIQVKAIDDEEGLFQGYGSTFNDKPDAYGDVIAEGAFKETVAKNGANGNGIALLWQHNSDEPIGVWIELVEDLKGLRVVGKLALNTQKGKEAYELLKMGAIKGLSIGYTVVEKEINDEPNEEKPWKTLLKKVNLWEISLVTFPANHSATITDVKAAIEKAQNKREFEHALREVGLSHSASKYITSLVKDETFERVNGKEKLLSLLKTTSFRINGG